MNIRFFREDRGDDIGNQLGSMNNDNSNHFSSFQAPITNCSTKIKHIHIFLISMPCIWAYCQQATCFLILSRRGNSGRRVGGLRLTAGINMGIELDPEKEANQLQDNVVLIINGLSESGRVLATMLAKQGADVAIADSQQDVELAHRIERDVSANGRRCLILTPSQPKKRSFSQYSIEKIMDTFGHLDAFISYSATDATETDEKATFQSEGYKSILFDQAGLTKAALRQILIAD
jgi:hypothetical protein